MTQNVTNAVYYDQDGDKVIITVRMEYYIEVIIIHTLYTCMQEFDKCYYQGWVEEFQYQNVTFRGWNLTLSTCHGLR